VPLTWTELDKTPSGAAFTLKNIDEHLNKKKLKMNEEFLSLRQTIKGL